jgi:Ca2+:H+ antiporter
MRPLALVRSELAVFMGGATVVLFLIFGKGWLADLSSPLWYTIIFAWLFGMIFWLSFNVVRHADSLAVLLGEPYGTLILTLAVISIEATMIAAVMIVGKANPTLARDTMFAVLMIVLNGMFGTVMLLGGWRHHAPSFNYQGANAYLALLVPLAGISLVLPRFTSSAPGGEPSALLAAFLMAAAILLYGVFLGVQTVLHSGYFRQPASGNSLNPHTDVTQETSEPQSTSDQEPVDPHAKLVVRGVFYHAILLAFSMLPIVLLAKSMATVIEHGIFVLGAPHALGGLLVAILVLSPEGLAACRAALHNQVQRSVNISLGSAVSTIGLTVPAVLIISFVTGQQIELGLDTVEIVLLVITLATIIVNASSGRTNVLQGAVHLVLFISYLVLIFDV